MKRIISLLLLVTLMLSTLALTGCGNKKNLKLGLGIVSAAEATDAVAATEEAAAKNGTGKATLTAAAILLNKKGKIVDAFIDCAESSVSYTADGKAVVTDSFLTKYEKGDAYNMVAYGKAQAEWYAQADSFCSLIIGKTVDEVKALLADNGKGTDEVIKAGCTIYVSDFVKAVEKAANNTVDCKGKVTEVALGVSTAQSTADAAAATEEAVAKAGYNQVETTFFAAAMNKKDKIVAASSDCVQVKFTFDENGASTFDATKAISSKKELGDSYNMVAYGQAKAEWYAQAAAFDSLCIGKTAEEVKSLMATDGKGVKEVLDANCTIYVSGFVKAAGKIAK